MQFKKTIPYKLKRLVPMLGLAGATLFTACEKDEPIGPKHDVVLNFYYAYYDEIKANNVQKVLNEPSINNIYLNSKYIYGRTFDRSDMTEIPISRLRSFLEESINLAPDRVFGSGNLVFMPGAASKTDSLWFVNNGWTVNKPIPEQKQR